MVISRPAPSTSFWCGSCRHSQVGGISNIVKVLPGCVITHSKTPKEWLGWLGMGGDVWGWVGMGWDGVLGSVGWVRKGAGTGAGRDSCG